MARDSNHLKACVADVTDRAAIAKACAGHDVIVNAVHPPYPDWAAQVPLITDAVIAAHGPAAQQL